MKTDITLVLDRSGSMGSIKDSTIEGVNSFIKSQQEIEGECTFTLWLFDDYHDVIYNAVDIKTVKFLDHTSYYPRGMTSLYDAICMSIDATGKRLAALDEKDRPDVVLFSILTDGEENSSKKYKLDNVNQMIKHQKEKYSWDFTFLGANQDAIASAGKFGISSAKAMTFAANKLGSDSAFKSISKYYTTSRTLSHVVGNGALASCAFDDEDRSWQSEAGV